MRTSICCIAALMGAMGIATEATGAGGSDAGFAGKRGLPPIVPMFTMDVPYVPAQDAPIVLAQAGTTGSATAQPDYLFNICTDTTSEGDPNSAERGVDPAGMLTTYIGNRDNRPIDMAARAAIKITLLNATTHGKLVAHTAGDGELYYMYVPTPEYRGNDQATFMAEFEGKRYKIVVDLHVWNVPGLGDADTCPQPSLSKSTANPSLEQ